MKEAKKEEAQPKPYRMPRVSVGDPIIWYPNASRTQEARPAFVTARGQDALAVAVFEKDSFSLDPHDGVRHISDPALLNPEARTDGAWDYSPMAERVAQLEIQMAELQKVIAHKAKSE